MRHLFGKIAVITGSALLGGALLAIAYVSAGAFILAGALSAVFLVGERTDVVESVFAPIAVVAAILFGAASWALASLGVGVWWLWRRKPGGPDKPPS